MKNKQTFFQIVIFALAVLIPFLLALYPLATGRISFWYDPARDFLLAYGNLHKLTLIGPTSGIPGLFYGPYWIWLLSFGLLFSLDPRLVIFLVLMLPYFTIFPFILYKMRTLFGMTTSILLWLLFIIGDGIHYSINPWNPNLAPLLFLCLVYLLTFTNFKKIGKRQNIHIFIIGILSGFIINFHISFGLGSIIGVVLFFILYSWRVSLHWKNIIMIFVIFSAGVILTFIPFFIFEIRHGFNQIHTALTTISSKDAVVAVKGLDKVSILKLFFNSLQVLLQIPILYCYLFFVIGITYFSYQIKTKKVILKEDEKKLLLILFSCSAGILSLYLTSKNPVWSYHFIGVEIIFLLFFGLLIHKNIALKVFVGILIIIFTYMGYAHTIKSFSQVRFDDQSLSTREYTTRLIVKDADTMPYTVFAYSPSIYTYEYSYIFKWIAHKDIPYDPNMIPRGGDLVYLIIPKGTSSPEDFTNSKTPHNQYKTVAHWSSPDGTEIIKRVKIK